MTWKLRKKNKMKQNFIQAQFITSFITSILLYILTFLQYKKGKNFWWVILLAGLATSISAYKNYKDIKKAEN